MKEKRISRGHSSLQWSFGFWIEEDVGMADSKSVFQIRITTMPLLRLSPTIEGNTETTSPHDVQSAQELQSASTHHASFLSFLPPCFLKDSLFSHPLSSEFLKYGVWIVNSSTVQFWPIRALFERLFEDLWWRITHTRTLHTVVTSCGVHQTAAHMHRHAGHSHFFIFLGIGNRFVDSSPTLKETIICVPKHVLPL